MQAMASFVGSRESFKILLKDYIKFLCTTKETLNFRRFLTDVLLEPCLRGEGATEGLSSVAKFLDILSTPPASDGRLYHVKKCFSNCANALVDLIKIFPRQVHILVHCIYHLVEMFSSDDQRDEFTEKLLSSVPWPATLDLKNKLDEMEEICECDQLTPRAKIVDLIDALQQSQAERARKSNENLQEFAVNALRNLSTEEMEGLKEAAKLDSEYQDSRGHFHGRLLGALSNRLTNLGSEMCSSPATPPCTPLALSSAFYNSIGQIPVVNRTTPSPVDSECTIPCLSSPEKDVQSLPIGQKAQNRQGNNPSTPKRRNLNVAQGDLIDFSDSLIANEPSTSRQPTTPQRKEKRKLFSVEIPISSDSDSNYEPNLNSNDKASKQIDVSSNNSDSSDDFHQRIPRRKKAKMSWTLEEEKNLIRGVEELGVGKWREITHLYNFRRRTGTQLRDKFRNLVHNKRVGKLKKLVRKAI